MNKTLEEIKKRFEKKFVDQVMTPQGGREVWEWVESTISQTKQEQEKINWDINVRYEKDLETAFNKFIEKWCKSNFPHLHDSDENDGEFIRMKIRKLQKKVKLVSQTKQELIEEIKIGIRKRLNKMQYKIKSPYLYDCQTKKAYNRALEDVRKELLEDLKN